jgi:hypothetical protein
MEESMKFRDHLSSEECIIDDEQEELIYDKLFLGCQAGIALAQRGINDQHICFIILGEDDDCWFPIGGSTSSFWLPEYIELLQHVHEWLKKNAYEGKWGWSFEKTLESRKQEE